MKLLGGLLALAACALAAPAQPPIDPNNPLTNPATNHDLYLVNPGLLASANGHLTPDQVLTVQSQLAAQKNLEMVAAQLAAKAGVPPPAGIQPVAGQPTAAQMAHFQAQVQAHNQLREQAQVQAQLVAQFQAQSQALLQAQAQAMAAAAAAAKPRF
ncbi:hypothetical protein IWQ57_003627 [Coemansia nantahalensis]|uniref:Uncharacterized protein n=2 Tax=Coemansia TaxID=4863 RepID=A0ACC1L9G4_9FUNG|nr:hypothetical protein IWQ57_003627 [Coemansia nantahalensis]KAJ2804094.1 hypothetical protein H4R21_001776 [Coemansia helicoidea]